MSTLLIVPFALPLLAAALGILLRSRRGLQRAVTALLLAALVATGVSLVVATAGGEVVATRIGDWPAGLGIPFVADGFAALLLTVAAAMAAVCVGYAVARDEDSHPLFHPLVAVLLAGALGAFLTGDLFNVFVTFEVMLIASYVLLTLKGDRRAVRAGTIYVTVNLLASTLLLVGIGLVYGAAGTVELAALHGAIGETPTAVVGASLVVVAVSIKASLVPVHGWLPRVYPQAGPAVTALFSALLTKAGVYVLYRLASTVFADVEGFGTAIGVAAGITMVVGVLGAVGRGDVRGILSFHMVSQVGYLVLPLAIWTVAGVTAGIVYLLQYLAVKGALFLVAGTIETLTGTGELKRLGGMVRTRPWLAVAFALPAFALAGLPPTSGFVGKVLLAFAAFETAHWVLGGLVVAVSILTLLSMVKIWNGVFWGELTPAVEREPAAVTLGVPVPAGAAGNEAAPPHRLSRGRTTALVAPALVIGVLTIVVGLGAGWLVDLVGPAAEQLVDPSRYLDAIGRA
ncbi:monovalent cation/H+ antiporter subunit D family protein [Nitriliruptoraceae bacterium ZYF776]|nr:monovalent cation/H+ antiporter subunit D family protein [Profundirhabdus halotolerans]